MNIVNIFFEKGAKLVTCTCIINGVEIRMTDDMAKNKYQKSRLPILYVLQRAAALRRITKQPIKIVRRFK